MQTTTYRCSPDAHAAYLARHSAPVARRISRSYRVTIESPTVRQTYQHVGFAPLTQADTAPGFRLVSCELLG